jgi:predicted dehydrogenase
MAADEVRLAIVGCGGMARGHLWGYRAIRQKGLAKFTLSAMCDPIREHAEKFAEEAEAFQGTRPRVYTSVEEMLKGDALTAADICTPHWDHHISAVACLEAGLDVMVEKPIGLTVKATKKIIEAGEKKGRIVSTAENIRRSLGMRTVRWAIHERGMIGQPRMFFAEGAGYRPSDYTQSPAMQWRIRQETSGAGMVMDSGAHFVDAIRYLFGDVIRLYGEARTWSDDFYTKPDGQRVQSDVEDTWTATMYFESGLVGVWSWSKALPGRSFRKATYYGTEGSIEEDEMFHPFQSDAIITDKEGKQTSLRDLSIQYLLSLSEAERERLFPGGILETVTIECWDFVDAVAKRRPPDVDGWEGLKAKAISMAILESSVAGRSVTMDEVISGKADAYQRPLNERWGI